MSKRVTEPLGADFDMHIIEKPVGHLQIYVADDVVQNMIKVGWDDRGTSKPIQAQRAKGGGIRCLFRSPFSYVEMDKHVTSWTSAPDTIVPNQAGLTSFECGRNDSYPTGSVGIRKYYVRKVLRRDGPPRYVLQYGAQECVSAYSGA